MMILVSQGRHWPTLDVGFPVASIFSLFSPGGVASYETRVDVHALSYTQ